MGQQATPKVIVTRRLPDAVHERLTALFETTLNTSDTPMNKAALIDAVKTADVLVPTLTDRIDAEIINAAGPQLKLIANFGAGTEHIDRMAAHKRSILVTNTPGVLTEDTADFVMALILATSRRLVEADRLTRAGGFAGWTPTGILGQRVRGKQLGIIGMGRIGQAVARRAQAFGLKVNYHNRHAVSAPIENSLGAKFWPDLDEMLANVDIVSVNCPSTPATHHLINAARLAAMPAHGIIVNTSRGEVVDEAALAEALAYHQIAAAGLDVYENEPDIHPALRGLPNVILAPHIGSATLESRIEMGEKVMINIRALFDGHRCPDRVLPPDPKFKISA
ncbi:MAG TPA: D-glycerate dehydrogenase [Hellea balneolensis]|uniref:D-glycerate dehydrogenase n=1 Tax=Hellea balneolensis TaxID=287478 RepID=A0A7C5LVZ1_9PROT|nr:D-glycerate dehydrogenase [Hellea balneolensis]